MDQNVHVRLEQRVLPAVVLAAALYPTFMPVLGV